LNSGTAKRKSQLAELLFGTAGVPLSAKSRTTQSGIECIRELGLSCMEIQFGRGVKMSEESAAQVAQTAGENNITLSVHAPYFINLNAHEHNKIAASQERLLRAARIGSICGAKGVVFHPAFYLGDPPDQVYARVKSHLQKVIEQIRREGSQILIRPEVMGKVSQFGTLEEVLGLSAEVEGVAPCLDFAHWHARTGKFNSYSEFMAVLDLAEERLGRGALDDIHIHVSGILYGEGGERKHLRLKESDLQYTKLLKALKERNARGLVICESPNLEEDALLLQRTYRGLS
jgi:deoxyribonuclease-4